MKKIIIFIFCFAIQFSIYSDTEYNGKIIKDIQFNGIDKLDIELPLKIGEPYDDTKIKPSIQQLQQSGIVIPKSVELKNVKKGVIVIFNVEERPIITEIKINKEAKHLINIKKGDHLNETKLKEEAEKLEELYKKSGYSEAEVSVYWKIKNNKATVIFDINKGNIIKIKRVFFTGIEHIKAKTLKSIILTKKSSFLRPKYFNKKTLNDDKLRIINFYKSQGFLSASIRKTEVIINNNEATIIFDIDEGRRYKIDKVFLKGDIEIARKKLPNLHGMNYIPADIQKYINKIKEEYGNQGFLEASIKQKLSIIDNEKVNLTIEIHKGAKLKIGKISIKGNKITKDYVIKREILFKQGETAKYSKLKQTQKNLLKTGLFSDVKIETKKTSKTTRDIVINISEAPRGEISAGGMYSTNTDLSGTFNLRYTNFDLFDPPYFSGGGQKLFINLTAGNIKDAVNIEYFTPWIGDRHINFKTHIYTSSETPKNSFYTTDTNGISFHFLKDMHFGKFSIGYRFEDVDLSYDNISKNYKINKIETQLSNKTIKAKALVGFGTENFYETGISAKWYFNDCIVIKVKTSLIEALSGEVPLYEKYYLGGAGTIRGFSYRSIGPHIGNRNIGGQFYAISSIEYTHKIFKNISAALFLDAGNCYKDISSVNSDINASVGIGLKIKILSIPLSIYYGIPIITDEFNKGATGTWNIQVKTMF